MIAAVDQQNTQPSKPLQPWYCPHCLARGYNQMLMRVYLAPGTIIEVKCPRCKEKHTRAAA
jgi:phage FluMu protein Com